MGYSKWARDGSQDGAGSSQTATRQRYANFQRVMPQILNSRKQIGLGESSRFTLACGGYREKPQKQVEGSLRRANKFAPEPAPQLAQCIRPSPLIRRVTRKELNPDRRNAGRSSRSCSPCPGNQGKSSPVPARVPDLFQD